MVHIQNILRDHMTQNKKKIPQANLFKKQAEDLNKHFSKDDMQMTNRYIKRYPTSLIIRDMKIKQ